MLMLKEYINKMTEQYDDLVEAIEKYEKKPTQANKKKVINKSMIFGKTKGVIMSKIRDFIMY